MVADIVKLKPWKVEQYLKHIVGQPTQEKTKKYLSGGQQRDAVDRFSNYLPLSIES